MTQPTTSVPPRSPSRARRVWRKVRVVWATTGSIVLVVFVTWSLLAYRPAPEARDALRSGAGVRVERGDGHWRFAPEGAVRPVGLVFFPGGLVDPVAYAPLARAASEAGFPAILMTLPRRGAFGGADDPAVLADARRWMDDTPGVSGWVVAGHSLGGDVAARFALRSPRQTAALLLLGTSHPKDYSLAALEVPVIKAFATRDGLATPSRVEATRHNLPAGTRWVEFEGGNHCQFAWYGFQPGDRFADMPRQEQQRRTAALVLAVLREAEARPRADGVLTLSRPRRGPFRPILPRPA